jgi:putative alpha-1,2-mannosidase
MENLEKEAGNLSFDQVRSKAQESWNKELNKISSKALILKRSIFTLQCIILSSILPLIWMSTGIQRTGSKHAQSIRLY